MQFLFRATASLPRMAWCARINRDNPVVVVEHGSWVETAEGCFFEGIWNGGFTDGAFLEASMCLGSGGRTAPEAVHFAGVSHSLERLHLFETPDEVLLSNSLAFILTESGNDLATSYRFYDRDLMSFVKGLHALTDTIPTASGQAIRLVYSSNVSIAPDLTITTTRKPQPPTFSSYDDYVSYMVRELRSLAENAASASRHHTFSPLATISSGYDSPAAAVLAQTVGCTEALTFSSPRKDFGPESDSGKEIGRILGLSVREFDRTGYRAVDTLPEAEFLAVGTGGEDVVMCAFEAYLPGTLLFTGFLGDTIWGRLHPDPQGSQDYKMGVSPGGSTLAEFRLRVGFVHVPVPLLALTRHPDLHRISNSAEMRPWRSGSNRYDRPIPRRLVEERGVPRHLFGTSKRAVTQPFYFNEPLAEVLAPHSYEDFKEFLASISPQGLDRLLWRGLGERFLYALLPLLHRLNYIMSRVLVGLGGRLGIAVPLRLFVPIRFRQRLKENLFAVHWGVSRIRRRYQR